MVGPIVPSYDNLKITLVIRVIIIGDNVPGILVVCVTRPNVNTQTTQNFLETI